MQTKHPPKLSLTDAIRVVNTLFMEYSNREVPVGKMDGMLQTARNSSFFSDKINALQKFGLIEKRQQGILYLTDLAMQIIGPAGKERDEAILIAFKRINILSDLLQRYSTGKLPSRDVLKNLLYRTYQINKSTLEKWEEFIIDSFAVISNIVGSDTSVIAHTKAIRSTREQVSAPSESMGGYQFTIPLNSGEYIRLLIPRSATAKELLTTRSFIDALVERSG